MRRLPCRTALTLGLAMVVGLFAAASVTKPVLAADSSGSLSLPWATNTSWYFNGPHNWGDSSGPWNSLDLNGNGGTGQYPVLAATAGTVHFDGCGRTDGYVRIDASNGN